MDMTKWNKNLLTLFLLSFLLPVTAQEKGNVSSRLAAEKGWYMGVQGGVPFGISTFSSFGADQTRAGVNAGLYGGYRFNPVLSLELSMKGGKTALSAQDCCIGKGYWLGADANRYNAPVAGLDGWSYSDLKSSVSLQQYGLQLNMNVLGFFERTKRSRWTVEVSPLLTAVGTKATLKTISGNAEVKQDGTRWHLGMGGNLQAGYRLTKNLSIGIYSGITYLTGSRMDGAPEYRHKNNYLWESGVRLGWSFGKCGKAKKRKLAEVVPATAVMPVSETTRPDEAEEKPAEAIQPVQPEKAAKAETTLSTVETEEDARLVFPTIYFGFNRTDIAKSEQPKLQAMLEMLQAHPDVRITVTGWCDTMGSRAVNARYSLRRAEAVKAWLTKHGIDAQRITAKGAGSDYQEPDADKARRADTTDKEKEEQQ